MTSPIYYVLYALGALCGLFFLVISAAGAYIAVIKRIDIWESIKKDRAHWAGGAVPLLAIGLLRVWMPLLAANDLGQASDRQSDGMQPVGNGPHTDPTMILKSWSALWALGLIMFSSVMWAVPGRVIGFSHEYAPFLRTSPLICAIDMMNIVWELTAGLTRDIWLRYVGGGGEPALSNSSSRISFASILEGVAKRRFEYIESHDGDEDRAENGHFHEKRVNDEEGDGAQGGYTNADANETTPNPSTPTVSNTRAEPSHPMLPGRGRALAFMGGSLHPTIVLLTCKGPGVLLTQTMAGCYLASFVLNEGLYLVYTKRKSQLENCRSSTVKADNSRPTCSDTQSSPVPSFNNCPGVGRYLMSSSSMATTLCICLWTSVPQTLHDIRMIVVSLVLSSSIFSLLLSDANKIALAARWRCEVVNIFNTVITMQSLINFVDEAPSQLPWWWITPSWLLRGFCAAAAFYFASRNDKAWAKYDADKSGHPPVLTFALITVTGIVSYYFGSYDASATYKPNPFLWLLNQDFGF